MVQMRRLRTSVKGFNLIKQFEGVRLKAYGCPAGYPTIGYGHVIRSSESFEYGITTAQAEALLLGDIAHVEAALGRLIQAPLTQNQFDALVSFTFNLGAGALQRSTLRRKINRHHHEEAPNELMRWVFAGGRRLLGLVKRRRAEALLYSYNKVGRGRRSRQN